MKTHRLVTLGFLASCGLAMLAASACGDDDDEPLLAGSAGKAGNAGGAGKAGGGGGGSAGGDAGSSGASGGGNSGSGGSAGSGTGGAGNAGASGAGNGGAGAGGAGAGGAGNGGAGGGAGGGEFIICNGQSCDPASQYCLLFTPPKGAETGSCAELPAGCTNCDCVIANAAAINDVCENDDTVVCVAQDGGFTVNCNAPSALSARR
jgi:hypothetical protein